ncbi:MAG: Rne/Rng family ribonuclease [Paracoccaceae bacterium]
MAKKMLIDATHPEETRVVVLDGQKIEDFDFESTSKRQIAGNIYLAKVTRVEPSLQAAFVEYGGNRHGFLAFSEIHPDYYQIPKADRDALMAEEEAEARRYAEAAEARRNGEAEDRGEDSGNGDGDDDGDEDPRGSDEDGGDEGGDDGRPREMAESAGAEDDERVQEDWPGETAEAEGETPRRRRTRRRPASAAPASPDEAETPAEAPAPETPAEAPAVEEAVETPASDEAAEMGVTPPETPVEATSGTETPAPEASNADPDAPTPDATPKAAEAAPAAPETETAPDAASVGDASAEAENGEDDGGAESGEDEGDARRRRRSRRGGRARGRRRGKREDGEGEATPAAEADAPETRTAPSEEEGDVPAPPESVERDAGDFMAEAISARRIAQRRYKIQEVIKVRQILLVQVVKEERGNKGAALTTYLSLAGRYCVLMPNTARGGGISRKITNAADRKKLKEIAGELEVPKGMGLIVRTAGANRTKPEIKRDYEYLLRQWERIRETTLSSVAPTLIYEEGSLVKRVIRDLYTGDIDEILVEGEQGYREAKDYMGMLMPSHARHVRPWREQTPLYARFGVEQELDSLFNPTVQLKSGGYIVIGVTEALVAIDINSGKSTKEGSIEDTALKTNLEAADEIARQLKLRDLAGLVVIDFIDMDEGRNNRAVEKRMKDRLKDDRARIQMGRISSFGLMEMSRQRLRPGMIEATTAPCGHCHGTGVVRSDASLALAALRRLQSEAARNRAPELLARLPLGAASFLFNEKREHIAEIEGRFGVSVRIEADAAMVSPQFEVDRVKTPTRKPAEAPAVSPVAWTEPEPEPAEEAEVVAEAPPAAAPAAEAPAEAPAPAPAPAEDEEEAGRRRRGRRGGRRRRRDDAGAEGMAVIDAEETGDPRAAEAKTEPAKPEAGAEIAVSEAEAAAEIPAPKRTRRRRKPKEAGTEGAEAASEASAAEVVATPEPVQPQAAAGSTPPVPAETTEPVATRSEPVPVPEEEEAVPAVAETPPPVPVEMPSAPEAAELPAEAEEQPPAPATDPAEAEETPAPAADPAEAEETPAPAAETGEAQPLEPDAEPGEAAASAKPKRRGWWSLGG